MSHGKIDDKRTIELHQLAMQFPIDFSNPGLLHQALIHTSYANENRHLHLSHNERLEFLGDAVLELAISDHLFHAYPDYPEGELTKLRAAIVCEATLAKHASRLNLGAYLLFGKGEEASGGRVRPSTLADAFEAVIGAIYLDAGMRTAAQFVLNQLDDELCSIRRGEYAKDYKTMLQELVQRNGDCKIIYEVLAESGPDHDKLFTIAVRINGVQQGMGTGKSKKEAEQAAAANALDILPTYADGLTK
jgi:ribonuclease-3